MNAGLTAPLQIRASAVSRSSIEYIEYADLDRKRRRLILAAVADMAPRLLFGEVFVSCVAIGSTSDS